ncbi:HD-GYP domain-containing protein [Methylicorpusculum oleiharenae]|uniref:HD-GYP domain-containing protein n=1 Tax=Methylicorpusculum oleiharenae TaxID=1338687 RepID=UPI002EDB5B6B
MLGEAGHYNDNDTGVHIWRMAAYSRALAKKLGWSGQQYELLEMAAAMHDTGKIGIPDKVLRKPGKLDADEWRIMQTHTQIGYDILSKSDAPLFKLAAEIALNHHEKWDGGGYPNGLERENIPESARIVAIADVFDALAMNRPYKDAWPLENILDYMNESAGHHFDPQILNAFMSVLPDILTLKTQWNLCEINDQAVNMIPQS